MGTMPVVSPAARRASIVLRSARNPKKITTVFSKLTRLWLSTQVSHRGKYSIERLLALQEYTQHTSILRVFIVCIGTPLPMVFFVVALEFVPLQELSAGWEGNVGLWVCSAVICVVIASTMLVELKHLIDGVQISIRQALLVLLCVMVGDTALCMTAAAYLAFPIPFMSILMVPPLLAIVAVTLRITFGAAGFSKLMQQSAQMYGFVLFIFAQALTLLIYPVYQVLFDAVVNTNWETSVMLLLPVVKMITKNIVASSIHYMEDMLPESVIFTVDFFNAVYVATCMQRASSTITVTVIMTFDMFHTVYALRSLYVNTAGIKRRMNRDMGSTIDNLDLLEIGYSLCQYQDKLERQDLSQILLRSCIPHKLSAPGKAFLSRLEKYPLKNAVKGHSRRNSSILPDNYPGSGWESAKRLTTKTYALSTINVFPVKPIAREFRTGSIISAYSVPPSQILQRTLGNLFTTECMLLTEYLESFTPLFYASFLCVMVQLPNAQYHKEMEGITTENINDTVRIVFLNGFLECVSFFVLVAVIRQTIGINALFHLAFVLETQTALIQSKLVVWMLLTLTCRIVHYGAFINFCLSVLLDQTIALDEFWGE
ncbi:hypothetical protein P3T76_013217 [Phytophthora citrophthora]|uniref:Transmembrane protein n=1 Tax=Phytophthora citrophthora TaxID=4793 RepID=A0AAD9LCJ1_9STRA|nr:hypothetical protein P3T76_013217 [Phytophthora citrophthora]